MLKSEINKPNTFFYFAYGGDMFAFRIHMNNPTAEFVSIARIDDYRLDFIKHSCFWGGPTPTIVPTANGHVWGVIWRLHEDDSMSLNNQNGMNHKKYYIKYIQAHTPYIGDVLCRAYIQRVNPLPRGDNDEIPAERWPSWTMKEIMIYGAKEHGLPDCYIKQLKQLKHNGQEGALRTECLLNRYARDPPCECIVPGRIPRVPLKLENKFRDKSCDHKHAGTCMLGHPQCMLP